MAHEENQPLLLHSEVSPAPEKLSDLPEFYYEVGKRLLLGKDKGAEMNKDGGRGIDYLHRAAEMGHEGAVWDLQCIVGEGDTQDLDLTKSFEIYKRYAKEGNPLALSSLGVRYYRGMGVETNYKKAIKLYQKAIKLGHARAMYNLAYCYEHGHGVEKDMNKAVEFYLGSANGGYATAQFAVGLFYAEGTAPVEPDEEKAVEMWMKAANQGLAMGQLCLAGAYRDGIGVKEDFQKAANYFLGYTKWGYEAGWEYLVEILCPEYGFLERPREEGGPVVSHNTKGDSDSHEGSESEGGEEKKEGNEQAAPKDNRIYHVPSLYDILCLMFSRMWAKYDITKRQEAQAKLPAEICEAVKYGGVHCAIPTCLNYVYGKGRVERRFYLTVAKGGTERREDDIVLTFCSISCGSTKLGEWN